MKATDEVRKLRINHMIRCWFREYHRIQFRADGRVWAQQRPGAPYGVLLDRDAHARTRLHASMEMDRRSKEEE